MRKRAAQPLSLRGAPRRSNPETLGKCFRAPRDRHVALSRLIAMTMLVFLATSAFAAEYPAKPIRIIVPFSPGGGGDLTARKIAVKLSERTGASVFVENRAGASGNIG